MVKTGESKKRELGENVNWTKIGIMYRPTVDFKKIRGKFIIFLEIGGKTQYASLAYRDWTPLHGDVGGIELLTDKSDCEWLMLVVEVTKIWFSIRFGTSLFRSCDIRHTKEIYAKFSWTKWHKANMSNIPLKSLSTSIGGDLASSLGERKKFRSPKFLNDFS